MSCEMIAQPNVTIIFICHHDIIVNKQSRECHRKYRYNYMLQGVQFLLKPTLNSLKFAQRRQNCHFSTIVMGLNFRTHEEAPYENLNYSILSEANAVGYPTPLPSPN